MNKAKTYKDQESGRENAEFNTDIESLRYFNPEYGEAALEQMYDSYYNQKMSANNENVKYAYNHGNDVRKTVEDFLYEMLKRRSFCTFVNPYDMESIFGEQNQFRSIIENDNNQVDHHIAKYYHSNLAQDKNNFSQDISNYEKFGFLGTEKTMDYYASKRYAAEKALDDNNYAADRISAKLVLDKEKLFSRTTFRLDDGSDSADYSKATNPKISSIPGVRQGNFGLLDALYRNIKENKITSNFDPDSIFHALGINFSNAPIFELNYHGALTKDDIISCVLPNKVESNNISNNLVKLIYLYHKGEPKVATYRNFGLGVYEQTISSDDLINSMDLDLPAKFSAGLFSRGRHSEADSKSISETSDSQSMSDVNKSRFNYEMEMFPKFDPNIMNYSREFVDNFVGKAVYQDPNSYIDQTGINSETKGKLLVMPFWSKLWRSAARSKRRIESLENLWHVLRPVSIAEEVE